MNSKFANIVERIYEKDPRYKEEAYAFIMDALAFTQKRMKELRHISGEELLLGIKEYSMKQFGPLAINVLNHWGIKTTEDFGNIVFNMVENKVLSKTESDTIEEFKDVFDFEEVFKRGYRKKLYKTISRMRGL